MFSVRCNSLVKLRNKNKVIKKDLQRITKVKPFVNKFNQKEANFPSEKDDWKRFEKNDITNDLNLFYSKKRKIYPAYVSKRNTQVIVLIIPNGEKQWHYLAVKNYY